MVYLPLEAVISIVTVPEAAVNVAEDADVLALLEAPVASNAVIPLAFNVAPELITIISPVIRSVIISDPSSILKVSFPSPPVKVSSSAPPVIISAPKPPEIVSSPAPPAKISALSFPLIISPVFHPVILSIPPAPVRVNDSNCPVKSTTDPEVFKVNVSIFARLLLLENV